jgi:hypothetical protein
MKLQIEQRQDEVVPALRNREHVTPSSPIFHNPTLSGAMALYRKTLVLCFVIQNW